MENRKRRKAFGAILQHGALRLRNPTSAGAAVKCRISFFAGFDSADRS
jgi:hypothetical protein